MTPEPAQHLALFEETAQPAPGPEAAAEPATVLIVDDEAVLRAIAERVMTMAGHRVLLAASGEEAIEVAAQAGRVDLLFTDVVMRGMHGIALAAALRAERPGLRVLVTSGYTPDDVDRRGVGLAETPFLPKPYTPAELTDAVARLLEAEPASQPPVRVVERTPASCGEP